MNAFEQYLQTIQVPRLSYSFQENMFKYRWENCVNDFSMPVRITLDGENYQLIFPTTQWQNFKASSTNSNTFKVDRNFYITVSENK